MAGTKVASQLLHRRWSNRALITCRVRPTPRLFKRGDAGQSGEAVGRWKTGELPPDSLDAKTAELVHSCCSVWCCEPTISLPDFCSRSGSKQC
eukprot:s3420_g2.t1